MWVKIGDCNNKYFLVMKVRLVIMYIDYLINDNGIRFIRNDEIENEVLRFYKVLDFLIFFCFMLINLF